MGGLGMIKIEGRESAREASRHHNRREGGREGYFPVMPFASVGGERAHATHTQTNTADMHVNE